MPRMIPVSRVIGAVEAYAIGQKLGEEWGRGRLTKRRAREFWEEQGTVAVVAAGGAVALTAWNLARNRLALPVLVVGLVIGSGVAPIIWRNLQANRGALSVGSSM